MNLKNLFMLVLWSSMAGALTAEETGFQPKFEAGTTFVTGTAYEMVLSDGTYKSPISQLTWPVQPSLGFDFAVTLPWVSWTSTSIGFEGTFPLCLGTMVDEDWNAQESNTILVYGRSTQQSSLTSRYLARVEEGFQWNGFTFSAGGLYRWITWEGWNGTGTYQYSDPTLDNTVTFSGPIITYRQQWIIPYIGISWTFKAVGWTLTPSGRFSPITWCFDSDLHDYAPGSSLHPTTYQDSTSGGFYGQAGLEAEFPGGSGWTWGIRAAGELAYGAVGDTTSIVTAASASGVSASYPTTKSTAGTWYYEVGLTAFMRN